MKLRCMMGCGRSKLASSADTPDTNDYYHRKANSHDNGVEEVRTSAGRKSSTNGTSSGRSGQTTTNGDLKPSGKENSLGTKNPKDKSSLGTPLQANPAVTNSQLDFFRMLDEKIEKGNSYEEISEST